MRKSKHIKIVVHMPEDKEAFEKIYIEATLEAIKQLAQTAPRAKKKTAEPSGSDSNNCSYVS